ncbi:MAG: efflux RND transporter permease subunit [Candidatus Cloacimonetes bacterium]|nr:efflux RND transporter permease subunit [Candidatus Cloacimonadota bacterium]
MSHWFLKHQGVAFLFWILIFVLGLMALFHLPKQEDPEFPNWAAVVTTSLAGASPEQIDSLVTKEIEKKLLEVEDIKEIKSISKASVSQITVRLKEHLRDTEPVWQTIRHKLEDASRNLPSGASRPWLNQSITGVKTVVLSLSAESGYTWPEIRATANSLLEELRVLPQVGKAELWGEQEEVITVDFSPVRLHALGFSPKNLMDILVRQNALLPSGSVDSSGMVLRLQPSGNLSTVEDVKSLLLTAPEGESTFRLGDIATIRAEISDPPKEQMRFMGRNAIGIQLEMKQGGQAPELGKRITEFVKHKESYIPWGMHLEIVNLQPYWVNQKIEEFSENLVQAVLVVILVIFWLLGWKQSLVTAILIPMAFCMTFIAMHYLKIPLHMISIASLIIALGMMVDNGIVMTEAITNRLRAGQIPLNAALNSIKELQIPLLTSTVTTILAFSPVALAESAVGVFCETLPWVIGLVLLSSLFISITLTPQLLIGFIKPERIKPMPILILKLLNLYLLVLKPALRKPKLALTLLMVLYILILPLGFSISKIFFPPKDRHEFTMELWMPEGTNFKATTQCAVQLETYLLTHYKPILQSLAVYIGRRGPKFAQGVAGDPGSANYAQIFVATTNMQNHHFLMGALKDWLSQNLPEAHVTLRPLESGPEVGAPIQLEIQSQRTDILFELAEQVKQLMYSTDGLTQIRDDWGNLSPWILLKTDQEKLRLAGVSNHNLSTLMQAFLSGLSVSDLRSSDEARPILFRAEAHHRQSLAGLEVLQMPGVRGNVPVLQLAEPVLVWESARILRKNGQKNLIVEAFMDGNKDAPTLVAELQKKLLGVAVPPSAQIRFLGETKTASEAQKSLLDKLPLAFSLLVITLALQFGSLRCLILVLMPIPLALGGVIVGLYLSGFPFGFMAFLGIISLFGIVINNSILLIEAARLFQKEGISAQSAALRAGEERLFPIVLTTVTTVLGLIPLAIGGNFWGPMAISIIGGLIGSTIMTLISVPLAYTILFSRPRDESLHQPQHLG